MEGVRCAETMSVRVLGAMGVDGDGADGESACDCTFDWRSEDTRCPERISGSGTLPVSSACDCVVMGAARGTRDVGRRLRVSLRALRAVRARSAIL